MVMKMCLQCVVDSEQVNILKYDPDFIVPDGYKMFPNGGNYSFHVGKKDSQKWPLGYVGVVFCNDPSLVIPIEDYHIFQKIFQNIKPEDIWEDAEPFAFWVRGYGIDPDTKIGKIVTDLGYGDYSLDFSHVFDQIDLDIFNYARMIGQNRLDIYAEGDNICFSLFCSVVVIGFFLEYFYRSEGWKNEQRQA